MDYRCRKYYLIQFNVYSKCDLECQEILKNEFNCKINPPYNHYEYGQYDGNCIDKYVTGMLSVPISKDEDFHKFINSKLYNIKIIYEINQYYCGH